MKNLQVLNRYRVETRYLVIVDETLEGAFVFASPQDQQALRAIACVGEGWDHVSVSRTDRCPTWDEMEFVKRKFFREEETAMQIHVPPAKHINCHPYVLHIWRPHAWPIPLPPRDMI